MEHTIKPLALHKRAFFLRQDGRVIAEHPTAESARDSIRRIAKTKGLTGNFEIILCSGEIAENYRKELADAQA